MMRIRFRIGPFTFGRTGVRLSFWRRSSGFSIPLFNRRARSFGKFKVGPFSFYIQGRSRKNTSRKSPHEHVEKVREVHSKAYEPWTKQDDEKLVWLFRKGKTVQELSEIFGRTKGAIHSRIEKLLLQ